MFLFSNNITNLEEKKSVRYNNSEQEMFIRCLTGKRICPKSTESLEINCNKEIRLRDFVI